MTTTINLKPKSDHIAYIQHGRFLVSDKYSTIMVSCETINQKCYVNKMYLYQAPPNYNMLKDNTAFVEKIPLHIAQEIKKLIDSLILKNQAN